jgi:hypothetical protein
MAMNWGANTNHNQMKAFCYAKNGTWYLRVVLSGGNVGSSDVGHHSILCIPRKMFNSVYEYEYNP